MGVREIDRFLEQWQMDARDLPVRSAQVSWRRCGGCGKEAPASG